jgi:hypothetical protein
LKQELEVEKIGMMKKGRRKTKKDKAFQEMIASLCKKKK